MIRLITLDAGHTLGVFGPPGTDELLCSVSPLNKARVKEEARRFLHTTPKPTEEVIKRLCGALMTRREDLPAPGEWPRGRFTPYPYAADAVTAMLEITGAKAVVISNIPNTTGPGRMADLRAHFPMIDHTYTSYDMQMRKPDAELWQIAAADRGVELDEIVHIGDQWINDVHGAVFAGCRAIYVNTRGYPPPPDAQWPAGRDRIGTTTDLRGAVHIIQAWREGGGIS